ncbi:hypothetical protein [Verrucomicrobium spinosum]|uniref:hypothetical protein n=1 Tax=Verrucomicrobium spinosum TaxID=2736 RepID=UPI0001744ECF|nr:hypothetical protein [Verrucomicrobium spinosum]
MSHLDLTFSSRRQWCAAALFALAGGGFLTQAEAADAVVPDVKIVFSELLLWADRVAGMEMQFDHPREAQAEAFKGLGRDAAVVLKVAGNKEGHLLELDEKSRTLTLRTVAPANEDRGIDVHLSIHPFADRQQKWMYPPSAGGEVPTHPLALVAVSTSDAEGDVEARSFQLYQYGRIGRRVVLSAVKGLGPFMDQVPEAPLCLPKGESTKALVVAVDAARKHALAEGGQGWDEESTFEALRKRLAQEDHAPQWSLHRAPKGDGVLIQPYWINAGGTDMVLEWASLGGSATPALFKPLTGLVRALYYEWDAAKGQFLFKGTAPRPDDVEFLFMETGEKVE